VTRGIPVTVGIGLVVSAIVVAAHHAGNVSTTSGAERSATVPDLLEHCGVRALAVTKIPELRWEDCGTGTGCRALATPWSDTSTPIAYHPLAAPAGDDRVWLSLAQVHAGRNVFVVARDDGAILSALEWEHEGRTGARLGCYVVANDLNEGKIALQLRAKGSPAVREHADRAALGGDVDRPAGIVAMFSDAEARADDSYRIGARWLTRIGESFELTAHDVASDTVHAVHSPASDPEQLPARHVRVHGDAIFFTTASRTRSGINVWTKAHGARPLLRWAGNSSRGAGNLGTDGTHLVWSEGEGKDAGTSYPERYVVTAPFTTNPEELRPRRLRRQQSRHIADRPWQVGCGRAAHQAGNRAIEVVDLKSGDAFVATSRPGLVLAEPLAVTCSELYAAAYLASPDGAQSSRYTIVRLALSELEPVLVSVTAADAEPRGENDPLAALALQADGP
jgi:hypothetical protein